MRSSRQIAKHHGQLTPFGGVWRLPLRHRRRRDLERCIASKPADRAQHLQSVSERNTQFLEMLFRQFGQNLDADPGLTKDGFVCPSLVHLAKSRHPSMPTPFRPRMMSRTKLGVQNLHELRTRGSSFDQPGEVTHGVSLILSRAPGASITARLCRPEAARKKLPFHGTNPEFQNLDVPGTC
jgi:hypothetical protein